MVLENTRVLTLPSDLTGETLSYNPDGKGTHLDLKRPAWNEAARAELRFDFPVGPTDAVVIGLFKLIVYVQETSNQPYSFTVVLEDVFASADCPNGICIWPVASGRRYRRTGELSRQEIRLDPNAHRFAAGHTIRVVISNLAILTHADGKYPDGYPMYAPSTTPYTVEFYAMAPSGKGGPANMRVPILFGPLITLAPPAWQLP